MQYVVITEAGTRHTAPTRRHSSCWQASTTRLLVTQPECQLRTRSASMRWSLMRASEPAAVCWTLVSSSPTVNTYMFFAFSLSNNPLNSDVDVRHISCEWTVQSNSTIIGRRSVAEAECDATDEQSHHARSEHSMSGLLVNYSIECLTISTSTDTQATRTGRRALHATIAVSYTHLTLPTNREV